MRTSFSNGADGAKAPRLREVIGEVKSNRHCDDGESACFLLVTLVVLLYALGFTLGAISICAST